MNCLNGLSGYTKSQIITNKNENVTVLTPKSYVKTFSKGLIPEVHKSIRY